MMGVPKNKYYIFQSTNGGSSKTNITFINLPKGGPRNTNITFISILKEFPKKQNYYIH